MHISLRIKDKTVEQIKELAQQNGITVSQMTRQLITTGLDNNKVKSTKVILETLCLSRRIAANIDIELLERAREDAQILLEKISKTY